MRSTNKRHTWYGDCLRISNLVPFLIWWERPVEDSLEEHKAAGISLVNLHNIKVSLACFIKGVFAAQLSLPASVRVQPWVCHSRYEFQEILAWKKNVARASMESDIPLTQQCLHKEVRNESRQSHTHPSCIVCTGKEKHMRLRRGKSCAVWHLKRSVSSQFNLWQVLR